MSDQVGKITTRAQFEALRDSGKLIYVDFYADWCGPCRMISPVFEQLAKEHIDKEGVEFYKFNTDDITDLAGELGIQSIPTFHAYKKGERVDMTVGANRDALRKFVQSGIQQL